MVFFFNLVSILGFGCKPGLDSLNGSNISLERRGQDPIINASSE